MVDKPLGAVVSQATLSSATADVDVKCDIVDTTSSASAVEVFQITKRAIATAFTAEEVNGRRGEVQRRVPRVGERLQITQHVGGRLRGEVGLRAEVGLVEPTEDSRIARNTISDSFHRVIVVSPPTHGNEFDTEVVVESVNTQRSIESKVPVIPPTNARGEGCHVSGRVVSISNSTLTAAGGDISWTVGDTGDGVSETTGEGVGSENGVEGSPDLEVKERVAISSSSLVTVHSEVSS
jgi:hypothetical protein